MRLGNNCYQIRNKVTLLSFRGLSRKKNKTKKLPNVLEYVYTCLHASF